MTEWAPTPLVLTEEDAKVIKEHLHSVHDCYDVKDTYDKVDQFLFECRLARNPEVIATLRKSMEDIKNGNLVEREI